MRKRPDWAFVTDAGACSYIFETRRQGKMSRITICDVRTWTVAKAQAEATRYKANTDKDIGPRQVRAEQMAAQAEAKVTNPPLCALF